jgi:sortase A
MKLRRRVSTVLICAGALLLADAVLTLVWQEPISAIYTSIEQDELNTDLNRTEHVPMSPAERRALRRLDNNPARVAYLARRLEKHAHEGQPIGHLRIPKLGEDWVMVEGTASDSLRKGPAHYRDTSLPGTHGTFGVAGHRTTYGAPFHDIDRLRRGDRIVVQMPYATFTYGVEGSQIVDPKAVQVLRRVGHDRIVLSACHPLYSAAQRIVVFARLESTEAFGTKRLFS